MRFCQDLGILLCLMLFVIGCDDNAGLSIENHSSIYKQREQQVCLVLRVFDGDTVGCDLNHNSRLDPPEETIRLLGLDAPETKYGKRKRNQNMGPLGQDDPFAKDATDLINQLVHYQQVRLVFDQVRHDRYGRTLAILYTSEQSADSVNETLLKSGFAIYRVIPPNTLMAEKFLEAENQARHAKRGIWQVDD